MENFEYDLAMQFALQTNQHIFLTGKAGSGKTTLLKNITSKTTKNFVVAAPTGVAAINAGGVTLHSLFHLPLTSFIPTSDYVDMNVITNRKQLLSHMKFSSERRRILEELELLIIDEVSMVRSDILDAVEFVLRMVRKNPKPFGGVQVMLFGDMHQLPPVTRENEWMILRNYYSSPYFFDAMVWKNLDAVQIELQKIYRQQDQTFLRILNNIRNKKMIPDDFVELEKRYEPKFDSATAGSVLLSTHNRKVDNINEQELNKLTTKPFTYTATIEGDFPGNMYPNEAKLQLKVGAQVMFIRNDAETAAYYNGKLATVIKTTVDNISVRFNDSGEEYILKQEIWENTNYSFDQITEKIEKKIIGTFSQYPLRLAWAITIHKSQGLTFDKVIIDAGQSFAAGQVYVALSRCRTLEGIVLHSRITEEVLFSDEKINSFSGSHHQQTELETILAAAKKRYAKDHLKKIFAFDKLTYRMEEWRKILEEKDIPEKQNASLLVNDITVKTHTLNETALKFQNQLEQLVNAFDVDESNLNSLIDRASKAIEYFTDTIYNLLLKPIHDHAQSLAYKTRVKKYVQFVQTIEDNFWSKINQLYVAHFLEHKLFSGQVKFKKENLKSITTSITSTKKEKGGTYNDTLDLYRQGKTIDEIAAMRGLAGSTIKTHFAKWITAGEIDILKVFNAPNLERIEKFLSDYPNDNFSHLKSTFDDEFDYNDIRMVKAHQLKSKN